MREREFKQTVVDEFLAFVEDPRIERTRKHPLETILVISLMAVICGADGFVGIERFAIAKVRAKLSSGMLGDQSSS
jgi:DDE_Tnp_1-associated